MLRNPNDPLAKGVFYCILVSVQGRTPMITTDNCFESPEFNRFWDEVEMLNGHQGWDDGLALDEMVAHFNEGTPTQDAAAEIQEALEIGAAEAAMSIPSWA